jgi:putative phosphoribosyl transferase
VILDDGVRSWRRAAFPGYRLDFANAGTHEMSTKIGMAETQPVFLDRAAAGDALARALTRFANQTDVVVLGLARGGVPIARRVSDAIGAPFSVLVSCKISVPGIDEMPLGAVSEGSDRMVPDPVAWYIGVPSQIMDRLSSRERVEMARRIAMFRDGEALLDVEGRTVILVDDGLASGATLRAAARAIRDRHPKRLIAAVPVASSAGLDEVREEVDEMIALAVPRVFDTVSSSYQRFEPVTDDDVLTALGRPTRRVSRIVHDISRRITDAERRIDIRGSDGRLVGDLATSQHIDLHNNHEGFHERDALVILAHTGNNSRDGYRNRYIAGRLRLSGYATLRVDLLTKEEQPVEGETGEIRFDVARIAARLTDVCDWAVRAGVYGAQRTILLGAGTSAAAALSAAAQRQGNTLAVVTRGGRVDLATPSLSRVRAPVLMIVGEADHETLEVNRRATQFLPRRAKLIRIPGTGHTFAEPGALGAVAEHTARWLDGLTMNWARGLLGSRGSAS